MSNSKPGHQQPLWIIVCINVLFQPLFRGGQVVGKLLMYLLMGTIPIKLPWIFLGTPLKVNGVPRNNWGNLTDMGCSLSQQWKSMMTSSDGKIFRITGPLCRDSPATDEFPARRPVTRSFDVFFDLHLNKPLSTQSWAWRWWFETRSHSLWCHCNGKDSENCSLFYVS